MCAIVEDASNEERYNFHSFFSVQKKKEEDTCSRLAYISQKEFVLAVFCCIILRFKCGTFYIVQGLLSFELYRFECIVYIGEIFETVHSTSVITIFFSWKIVKV